MVRKISAPMQAVIDRMQATGKPLHRWPGGWWTTRGTPAKENAPAIPAWECGTTTVNALERRGLICRANVAKQWWQDDFVLTLTDIERRALGLVKHGADVYDYAIAKTLRALEKRGLVTITAALMPPSGEKTQPYFGAKAKADMFDLGVVSK